MSISVFNSPQIYQLSDIKAPSKYTIPLDIHFEPFGTNTPVYPVENFNLYGYRYDFNTNISKNVSGFGNMKSVDFSAVFTALNTGGNTQLLWPTLIFDCQDSGNVWIIAPKTEASITAPNTACQAAVTGSLPLSSNGNVLSIYAGYINFNAPLNTPAEIQCSINVNNFEKQGYFVTESMMGQY